MELLFIDNLNTLANKRKIHHTICIETYGPHFSVLSLQVDEYRPFKLNQGQLKLETIADFCEIS